MPSAFLSGTVRRAQESGYDASREFHLLKPPWRQPLDDRQSAFYLAVPHRVLPDHNRQISPDGCEANSDVTTDLPSLNAAR